MASASRDEVDVEWGLRLIYDSRDDKLFTTARDDDVACVEVDIIAVHGLWSSPNRTWVHSQKNADGTVDKVNWLIDLLPQTLHNYKPRICARIFCYNYQSAWLGRECTANRLETAANRLLSDIRDRKPQNDFGNSVAKRPLIFIGHSFGGLVIEQAIVLANQSGSSYEYLVDTVGGIILLGTPHQGSRSQGLGSFLARLAKVIDLGQTVLMDDVDEDSMKIFDMVKTFKQIIIQKDLAKMEAVVCFFENRPTDYLKGRLSMLQTQTSTMVVEERSAVLFGHGVLLDSDHLKLNKFPNADNGNYLAVSSTLCRLAAGIPQLSQRRQQDINSFVQQERYWEVPRNRVKNFVGREDLLREMLSFFSTDAITRPRALILQGLGGQGKSQIALEYCRRTRDKYRGTFWINASSEQMMVLSYGKMVEKLTGRSMPPLDNGEAIIQEIVTTLETWQEQWLLIFDNYDDRENFNDIGKFIPDGGKGDVIITSRHRGTNELGYFVEVPKMTPAEGIKILLRLFKSRDIQQYNTTATSIVNRLEGLPLALHQASAYIEYRNLSLNQLGDFLTSFENLKEKVLKHIPKEYWIYNTSHIHGDTVRNQSLSAFTTWEMSFHQFMQRNEHRQENLAHFLGLSAFLNHTKINESLFKYKWEWQCLAEDDNEDANQERRNENEDEEKEYEEREEEDETGDEKEQERRQRRKSSTTIVTWLDLFCNADKPDTPLTQWDSDKFWDVLEEAYKLSLLQTISNPLDGADVHFSFHPLIRDWLQLRLPLQHRQRYVKESMELVVSSIRRVTDLNIGAEYKMSLIAHLNACLSNHSQYCRYSNESQYDLEDCRIIACFAFQYLECGFFKQAEALYRSIVTTRTELQGSENLDAVADMEGLAMMLKPQEKYAESERIYRQVLGIRIRALGSENLDTLKSLDCLASALHSQAKYSEAEKTYRQLASYKDSRYGKEHPSTCDTILDLASTLRYQGKYREAEQLCQQILDPEKRILREENSIFKSLDLLIWIFQDQGRNEEAKRIYQQVLQIGKGFPREESHNILANMELQASIFKCQGDYGNAEKVYRQLIDHKKRLWGDEHPQTVLTSFSLAIALLRQGKDDEAERLCRQAMEIKTLSGEYHPNTIYAMRLLASILHGQDRYDEEAELLQQILDIGEKGFGKEHRSTLQALYLISEFLFSQKRYTEAKVMQERALDSQSQVLGAKHPDTLRSMHNLASILYSLGQDDEAIALMEETANLEVATLGSNHSYSRKSLEKLESWRTSRPNEAVGLASAPDQSAVISSRMPDPERTIRSPKQSGDQNDNISNRLRSRKRKK